MIMCHSLFFILFRNFVIDMEYPLLYGAIDMFEVVTDLFNRRAGPWKGLSGTCIYFGFF